MGRLIVRDWANLGGELASRWYPRPHQSKRRARSRARPHAPGRQGTKEGGAAGWGLAGSSLSLRLSHSLPFPSVPVQFDFPLGKGRYRRWLLAPNQYGYIPGSRATTSFDLPSFFQTRLLALFLGEPVAGTRLPTRSPFGLLLPITLPCHPFHQCQSEVRRCCGGNPIPSSPQVILNHTLLLRLCGGSSPQEKQAGKCHSLTARWGSTRRYPCLAAKRNSTFNPIPHSAPVHILSLVHQLFDIRTSTLCIRKQVRANQLSLRLPAHVLRVISYRVLLTRWVRATQILSIDKAIEFSAYQGMYPKSRQLALVVLVWRYLCRRTNYCYCTPLGVSPRTGTSEAGVPSPQHNLFSPVRKQVRLLYREVDTLVNVSRSSIIGRYNATPQPGVSVLQFATHATSVISTANMINSC
ncbi:hypothetical protein PspLS_08517 [Pyricularia sp. CBS 133598]|nr:hypothetical protein PspLS_08517 [Pyricularia sp. CBS 133598]